MSISILNLTIYQGKDEIKSYDFVDFFVYVF